MGAAQIRTLQDAIGSVRQAEGECVVLMGAGCSLSGGVPLANRLILEIQRHFPEAYARATKTVNGLRPGYNALMEQLSPKERQALLNKYIEKAKINWAHLALAQLFKQQKIERVLTVNFDPLLVQACALVGFFPAIYDFANLGRFDTGRIAKNALFYLNGQHTGFVMLNAQDELQAHQEQLQTIVSDTATNRVWLVVGYSGEADPLLQVLASQHCFNGDLYWLGFDAQPSAHLIASGLFNNGRRAFYVGSQDADACLSELAKCLGCFPPEFLTEPHAHMRQLLEMVKFETGGDFAKALYPELMSKLGRDKEQITNGDSVKATTVTKWLLAGEYQKTIDWYQGLEPQHQNDVTKNLCAWAWIAMGVEFAQQAINQSPTDLKQARHLWMEAGKKFTHALAIKPDRHEAANYWGVALDEEALAVQSQDLSEARRLWSQAGEKYAQALAIKPEMHHAAYNWGVGLNAEAQAVVEQDPDEARRLWKRASEKYAKALVIKPDLYQASTNWGVALNAEAELVVGQNLTEARKLWAKAGEKYAQALAIKPDMHDAAYNWGVALDAEAQAVVEKDKCEALRLWMQAGEKYAQALAINPDMHIAANNWGNALHDEAHAVVELDTSEARRLWMQAGEKYAQALAIKPDMHKAASNLGYAIAQEAIAVWGRDPIEARRLWAQAGEKYAQALAIKPDMHDAAYNWGVALNAEAQAVVEQDPGEARRLWMQAGEKYAQALAIKPDSHEAAYNWGIALSNEAEALKSQYPVEARRLWTKAGEKYAQALSIKPNKHEAAFNWGNALITEAQALKGQNPGEARRLWAQAGEKYAQALAIKPDLHVAAYNWSSALIFEWHTAEHVSEKSRVLAQAQTLLERHAQMDESGRETVAYNLACVYSLQGRAAEAVVQLEISRLAGKLLDQNHLAEDKDLDPIRQSLEFQSWWEQHFGKS